MLGMGVAEEVADSLPEGHGFRATNISGRRFERNRKLVDSPLEGVDPNFRFRDALSSPTARPWSRRLIRR
jgi:hypothetical protein